MLNSTSPPLRNLSRPRLTPFLQSFPAPFPGRFSGPFRGARVVRRRVAWCREAECEHSDAVESQAGRRFFV